EHRINEQQAACDAERQSWDQQLEEHAQMAAVWESLAREVEQVQAGLIDDRDALTREVGKLRDQLGESEKSRNEVEGKLREAGARWETERQELQARWEQQRQEILADAERRLAAQRDALEAERQARRRQADVGSALESLREEIATLQRALEDIRRER